MKSAHAVFILLAASVSFVCDGYASAQTYSCPTSEVITVGTIESGSYLDLCAIDGSYEVLREGLYNGKSKLQIKYVIPNVPPGAQSINFWGIRPANSEGDNFQFYYTADDKPFGILIQGAIINHPFAPTGGITIPLLTTTETKTFTIFLTDTNNNGPILDSVTLDAVRICTQ